MSNLLTFTRTENGNKVTSVSIPRPFLRQSFDYHVFYKYDLTSVWKISENKSPKGEVSSISEIKYRGKRRTDSKKSENEVTTVLLSHNKFNWKLFQSGKHLFFISKPKYTAINKIYRLKNCWMEVSYSWNVEITS